jgi:hypothetical protein
MAPFCARLMAGLMIAAGFPALVSLHVHSPAFVLAYLLWTIAASVLATGSSRGNSRGVVLRR